MIRDYSWLLNVSCPFLGNKGKNAIDKPFEKKMQTQTETLLHMFLHEAPTCLISEFLLTMTIWINNHNHT